MNQLIDSPALYFAYLFNTGLANGNNGLIISKKQSNVTDPQNKTSIRETIFLSLPKNPTENQPDLMIFNENEVNKNKETLTSNIKKNSPKVSRAKRYAGREEERREPRREERRENERREPRREERNESEKEKKLGNLVTKLAEKSGNEEIMIDVKKFNYLKSFFKPLNHENVFSCLFRLKHHVNKL